MNDDEKVIVISWGLVCLSVCAPKSMDTLDVEVESNKIVPTGISSSWKISEDENFATGQPNGCDCDKFPETRRHFLLNC